MLIYCEKLNNIFIIMIIIIKSTAMTVITGLKGFSQHLNLIN